MAAQLVLFLFLVSPVAMAFHCAFALLGVAAETFGKSEALAA